MEFLNLLYLFSEIYNKLKECFLLLDRLTTEFIDRFIEFPDEDLLFEV
jgi:hypothetical protein